MRAISLQREIILPTPIYRLTTSPEGPTTKRRKILQDSGTIAS